MMVFNLTDQAVISTSYEHFGEDMEMPRLSLCSARPFSREATKGSVSLAAI